MDNRTKLREMRQALGFTQAAMAEQIGLSTRGYEELEAGRSEVKKLHLLAAEQVALRTAVVERDFDLLPDDMKALMRAAVQYGFGHEKPAS